MPAIFRQAPISPPDIFREVVAPQTPPDIFRNAGGPVLSVFGRTGQVVAQPGDYAASQVTNAIDLAQSYADPPWITSLAWMKITGAPSASSFQTPWASDIDAAGFRLKNAKALVVGPTPSGDDSSYLSCRTATNPLSLGGSHAFRDENSYNSSVAGDAGYASYDAVPNMLGTGALNHLNAFQARPQYAGTGNLDSLVSFNSQVTVNGPVANLFALRIYNPSGSGAITNQYGIWIDPLSRGGSSNYAIFAAGNNPTYLGGTLQIGADFTLAGSIIGAADVSTKALHVVYSDNGFQRGVNVQNTNTGTAAIAGIQFQIQGKSAFIDLLPPNYADPSSADVLSINTGGATTGINFTTNMGGTGPAGNIKFRVSATVGLFIKGSDGSGFVGIGVANPQAMLDVAGTVRFGGLPSTAPAAGSKQLWYDPADSNRVKYAP